MADSELDVRQLRKTDKHPTIFATAEPGRFGIRPRLVRVFGSTGQGVLLVRSSGPMTLIGKSLGKRRRRPLISCEFTR